MSRQLFNTKITKFGFFLSSFLPPKEAENFLKNIENFFIRKKITYVKTSEGLLIDRGYYKLLFRVADRNWNPYVEMTGTAHAASNVYEEISGLYDNSNLSYKNKNVQLAFNFIEKIENDSKQDCNFIEFQFK